MLAPLHFRPWRQYTRQWFLTSYGALIIFVAGDIIAWSSCYIMLREIHSERECSNLRKISNFFFFFFFWGRAWVRRFIRESYDRLTACCKFGSLPVHIWGVATCYWEISHLPLFCYKQITIRCYCELILGLASLVFNVNCLSFSIVLLKIFPTLSQHFL